MILYGHLLLLNFMRRELIRKFIHVLGYLNIIGFVVISEFIGERAAFLALTLVLLLFLEIEYLRVERKVLIPSQFNIFRKKEKSHFAGHIYMTLSAIVCFAAFSRVIASAALSMMILGDIASALIGKKWGTNRFIFSNKTWEGTIAGFFANIVAGYFFLSALQEPFIILIPMAAAASLVEVFTQKLDDNLTVSIFAGATGQAILWLASIV